MRENMQHVMRCILAISFLSLGCVEANWFPELVPAKAGTYRNAIEPIRLNFPPELSDDVYSRLALELDAIDISQLVVFEGNQLVFQTPQPLKYGDHVLRLVEYLDDGNIEEIGVWNLEVRQSSTFIESYVSLEGQLNGSHRFAEDYSGLDNDDERNGLQGAAELDFSAVSDRAKVSFQSDFLLDHQSRNTIRGEEFDLGEYLFQLEIDDQAKLNVGHHNVDHNSLIYDRFYRRGASVSLDIDSLNSRVQGFSMRTNDLAGFRSGLGIGDQDDRVTGVAWDYQPVANDDKTVTFTLSHLDGEGIQDGFNVADIAESNGGNASSFALDTLLLNQSLRIRGEYSRSSFDFDGEGQGFSKQKDDAHNYLITYAPNNNGGENSIKWNMGAEKLVVGSDFSSLANTYLASDKDLTRVFGGLNRGSWLLDGSFAYEEDNLNDDFAATNINRYGYLSGGYSRYEGFDESGFWHWLGVPSIGLTYAYTDQRQKGVELDAFTGDELIKNDITLQDVNLLNEFQYDNWSWYFGLGWSELQDHSDQQVDSQSMLFDLGANWYIANRFSISPGVQAETTHERDTHFDSTNIVYSLSLGGIFIEDKLYGNLQFNYNDFDATDDPFFQQESAVFNIAGDMVWNVFARGVRNPGVDLRLTGSYQDVDDEINDSLNNDIYQLFLNLDVNWGVASPVAP